MKKLLFIITLIFTFIYVAGQLPNSVIRLRNTDNFNPKNAEAHLRQISQINKAYKTLSKSVHYKLDSLLYHNNGINGFFAKINNYYSVDTKLRIYKSETYRGNTTSPYMLTNSYVYQFDNQDRVIIQDFNRYMRSSIFNGIIWVKTRKEITYNNQDRVIIEKFSKYDTLNGTYYPSTKFTYSYYSNGNIQSLSYYDYSSGVWEKNYKLDYQYDSLNRNTLILNWEGSPQNSWTYRMKIINTFNNSVDSNKIYIWDNLNQKWDFKYKNIITCSFSNNLNHIQKEHFRFVSNQWMPNILENKTKDTNNNLLEYTIYDFDTTLYKYNETVKFALTHDSYGDVTSYTDFEWNKNTQNWRYNHRFTFSHDTIHNKSEFTLPYEGVATYMFGYDEVFKAIGKHVPISINNYKWDSINNGWNTVIYGRAYYSTGSVSILHPKNTVFCIYPNPANNFIYFNSRNQYQEFRIKIYDLSGKMVLDKIIINQNKLSINTLQSGAYLYSIEAGKDIFHGKLIINP